MSEYQYYEFQAVDRPLTEREMSELRSCSSRATITATRFVNHYNWGSFKGNSSTWMERYFDAFLYLANWGTHELSIRLPRGCLALETAKLYCCSEAVSVRRKGEFLHLDFRSESDNGDDWDDDGSRWLSSLLPLRADLAAGDHRALYLGWLLGAQAGELEESETEPPIPAGLGNLTAPLQAFAEFLRIDGDLLSAAAAGSPEIEGLPSDKDLEGWIAALSDGEKTQWLGRFAHGREPFLKAELLRRFRDSRSPALPQAAKAPRTAGDLLAAAEQHARERHRREAQRAEAERVRRQQEEAEARERYLETLAPREAQTWKRVDALIATKQPGRYDEAVKLLRDLRDLGLRKGRAHETEARLLKLREEHARKPTLIERLKKAGLA